MYPLPELVSIWMALYDAYTLATDMPFVTETAGEALTEATKKYRGRVDKIIRAACDDYSELSVRGCHSALRCLDAGWECRGYSSPRDIDALSLFDFYKFGGAIWPHHDIALYVPEERRIMILRVDEQDFRTVERTLAVKTSRSPFLATFMQVLQVELYPVLGRVKRLHTTKIAPRSLRPCSTYSELISACADAFGMKRVNVMERLHGSAAFDLTRYFIARFGGGYAFYEPIISTADVTRAERDRHASEAYRIVFNLGDLDLHTQLAEQLIFDAAFRTDALRRRHTAFLALLPVGLTASELVKTPAQLLAVSHIDTDSEGLLPQHAKNSSELDGPTISQVRAELQPAPFNFGEFVEYLGKLGPRARIRYHEGDLVISEGIQMVRLSSSGEVIGSSSNRIRDEYEEILNGFGRRRRA